MFYAQKNTDNTYMLSVNGACHATAFNQDSDRDLKDNIQVIDNATDRIRRTAIHTLKENGMPHAGVIARKWQSQKPRFRNEISGRCVGR